MGLYRGYMGSFRRFGQFIGVYGGLKRVIWGCIGLWDLRLYGSYIGLGKYSYIGCNRVISRDIGTI